jgi:energy-coupling factor transport system ATP-binding protein
VSYIQVRELTFSYDQQVDVVDNVSFDVLKGTYTCIIGHNGSGKSSLAKLLIGLLNKKSGSIKIDDEELDEESLMHIRSKIGIVFQNPDNQFIGATVRDDIAFGLENKNVDPKEMDEIIHYYASKVHMLDYLDHEPGRLSGGQKQRVAIAGVLAMKPEIIILDEATSMLDPKGKKEVNDLVRELFVKEHMTIISITHDIEEALYCDHLLVMNEAKIQMDGKSEDILVNKKELVNMALDVPFTVKVQQALASHGIQVNHIDSLEALVDSL